METYVDRVVDLSPDRDNCHRPPNWRWQLARLLADRRRIPKSWVDPVVDQATRMIKVLRRCRSGTQAERQRLLRRFPTQYPAYLIYHESGFQRWEMEARFLARENFAQVAGEYHSQPDVVQAFHDLFFCCQRHHGYRHHILDAVMSRQMYSDVTEADYDVIFKLVGSRGGARILDDVVRQYKNPLKIPERLDQLDSVARKDLAASLMTRALILSFTTPMTAKAAKQMGILHEASLRLDRVDLVADPKVEPLIGEIRATIPFGPARNQFPETEQSLVEPMVRVA